MTLQEAMIFIASWLIKNGRGVRIDPPSLHPPNGRIITSITSAQEADEFIRELAEKSAHEASPDCMHGESNGDHSASCRAMAHRLEASYRDLGMTAKVRNLSRIKIMVSGNGYASGKDFINNHLPVDQKDIMRDKDWAIDSYIIVGQKDPSTIRIIDTKTSDKWVSANGWWHCPEDLVKKRNIG